MGASVICESVQADVKEMKFPDRTTKTGQLINKYLADGMAMEDHAIHLLFSANRWESKCAHPTYPLIHCPSHQRVMTKQHRQFAAVTAE